MPFRFRFTTLLSRRIHLFETAQRDLAAAKLKAEELRMQKLRVERHFQEYQRTLEEKRSRGIIAAQYLTFVDFLRYLEAALFGIEQEITRADAEVEEKKKVLLQQEKEVRMLEAIEKQDRRMYRYSQIIRERKQVDEVSIFRDFTSRDGSREEGP